LGLINYSLKKLKSSSLIDFIFFKKISKNNTPHFYVIGDSHVSVFSGQGSKDNRYMVSSWPDRPKILIDNYYPIRLGALTAYNSYKKIKLIKKTLLLKSLNINKNKDFIILSFGEIDIRVHLMNKCLNNTQESVVNNCVNNYIKTINEIHSAGYKLIILAPIASTPYDVKIDNYTPVGTCFQRNKLTIAFINKLREKTKLLDLPVISIFEEMIDENYQTVEEFLMDEIHLSSKYLGLYTDKIREYI